MSLAPSLQSLRLQPTDGVHPVRYTGEGYVVFNEKGTLGKICTENLNNSLPEAEMLAVLSSTAGSLCSLLTFELVYQGVADFNGLYGGGGGEVGCARFD